MIGLGTGENTWKRKDSRPLENTKRWVCRGLQNEIGVYIYRELIEMFMNAIYFMLIAG